MKQDGFEPKEAGIAFFWPSPLDPKRGLEEVWTQERRGVIGSRCSPFRSVKF